MRKVISLSLLALACASQAQAAYPDHTVRLVIGFAPGGSSDVSARLIGKKLSEKWGQPVVVESREGANTTIAEDYVAHAAPDGYTVLWAAGAHTIVPSLYKLNYDPVKSFTAVSWVASSPDVLVVRPDLGVNNIKDLIALAKSKPGQLNYASAGVGSPTYMAMGLLMYRAGLDMVNVNYKGGAPSLVATMGGEVSTTFASVTDGAPLVKSGKLRALGVSTKARSGVLPDVPTVAEASGGMADFDTSTWAGVLVPAGTPRDIVKKMHDDITEAVNAPDVQKAFTDIGFNPVGSTPEEFDKMIAEEMVTWSALLRKLDVKQ